MKDTGTGDWWRFLCWACQQLQLQPEAYRKVQRQVKRRLMHRMRELGLSDWQAYQQLILHHPEELARLAFAFRVTISRFFRDAPVWQVLQIGVLPELLNLVGRRGEPVLRVWSVGCASGEEPYSLSIVWHLGIAPEQRRGVRLQIVATDWDPILLERARRGCYPEGCLREVPGVFREKAFQPAGREWCLKADYRDGVTFVQQDLRSEMPGESFHLILCRNLVFTYFVPLIQQKFCAKFRKRLIPGGWLMIGRSEHLPPGASAYWKRGPGEGLYQFRGRR